MNLYHIKKISYIILLAGVCYGCGKYGYNFEDGYSKIKGDTSVINTDTSLNKPDFTMYSQAGIYPGLVDDTVTRLQNFGVDFDLNITKNPEKLRISTLPQPWLSSGMYAPTGEPIMVDVPPGVYGLIAQIGSWTDNLTSAIAKYGADAMKREAQIYTRQQLYPGLNYIRSPFGGPIYIIPAISEERSVRLTFSGAVHMTDFILGKTDPNEWAAHIKKSGVPWFELRAPHIIFTMNTEKARRLGKTTPSLLTNVEALMQEWEDIFNIDYTQWEGLSSDAPDDLDKSIGMPWRCVGDIGMEPGVGAHSGFPVVYTDNDHWFSYFILDYNALVTNGSWGILHEVGHNNQQINWMWSGMGETTNNLFSFKTGNRLGFKPQKDTLWTKPQINVTLLNKSVKKCSILDWAALDTLETGKGPMYGTGTLLGGYPIQKCLFFVQLFETYGYGLMTQLYVQTRHAAIPSFNDQDRVDFVYQVASQYAQRDLYVFFKFWGLTPSRQGRAVVAAMGVPQLEKRIWTYNPGTQELLDKTPIN